jgi:signal transduction histidine kinase
MSFRTRILLALLAVGVAPVALLGLMSYGTNREELVETVSAGQAQAAAEIARQFEAFVLNGVEHLEASTRYLPLARLSRDDAADALRIPFRQLSWVNVLVLLSERGEALAPPVFDAAPGPGDAGRDPIGPAELDAFARSVPLATVLASDVAIGPPYVGGRNGVPRVAVGVRIPGPPPRVLAAELSLSQLQERLEESAGADGTAFLVDAHANVIAHRGDERALSVQERQLVERGVASLSPDVRSVVRGDGRAWLAAFAPVGTVGWGVVLARPEALALRAASRSRAYTLFWATAALVTAAGLGTLLARGVSIPVRRLSEAARAVTEGRYDAEVAVERRDELGELAAAFNHMAQEVSRRDAEIRRWADELSRRVEQKTAELRHAQDQITRSRRLGALGSLGAGVAHEINNPMTAIVGLVSVARKNVGPDSREGQLLGTALEQAMRVTRIVDDLRLLAEHQRHDLGVQFSLATAARAAVEAAAHDAERAGVSLHADLQDGLAPVQGDPIQVQQLVGHLLGNAIAATPEGGTIRVSVGSVEDGALKLAVSDTGRGIPEAMRERIFDPFFTRKERGGGVGLGLTLANCIVEAHHGKLHVESEDGKGSTFTVLLPAAAAQAHLA